MEKETEIEKRARLKKLAAEMEKLSNEALVKELLKKFEGDEHVNELLRRYDHALGCLAEPNIYYKADVEDFVNGKKTSLKSATL